MNNDVICVANGFIVSMSCFDDLWFFLDHLDGKDLDGCRAGGSCIISPQDSYGQTLLVMLIGSLMDFVYDIDGFSSGFSLLHFAFVRF